jgi:hypothetical protein
MTVEYDAMFNDAGLKHIVTRRIKALYPLKVHIGEKELL